LIAPPPPLPPPPLTKLLLLSVRPSIRTRHPEPTEDRTRLHADARTLPAPISLGNQIIGQSANKRHSDQLTADNFVFIQILLFHRCRIQISNIYFHLILISSDNQKIIDWQCGN
jgi:hypothetical protein